MKARVQAFPLSLLLMIVAVNVQALPMYFTGNRCIPAPSAGSTPVAGTNANGATAYQEFGSVGGGDTFCWINTTVPEGLSAAPKCDCGWYGPMTTGETGLVGYAFAFQAFRITSDTTPSSIGNSSSNKEYNFAASTQDLQGGVAPTNDPNNATAIYDNLAVGPCASNNCDGVPMRIRVRRVTSGLSGSAAAGAHRVEEFRCNCF